jgi:hypothetical protein
MKMFGLGIVGLLVMFALVIGVMAISYNNQEVGLRNLLTAKAKDNQNEFDNMWKKINQVVQVAQKDRESLKDIFNSYATARTPQNNDAPLMRWIQESVPNVSQTTFANLQNVIVSSRDSWTARQKELIDYKREHDNLRMMFPSRLFVGGRPEILITVITSDNTEKVFKSGKDNDTDLFKK